MLFELEKASNASNGRLSLKIRVNDYVTVAYPTGAIFHRCIYRGQVASGLTLSAMVFAVLAFRFQF